MSLRSILKILLFPHRAYREKIRLTEQLAASQNDLADTWNQLNKIAAERDELKRLRMSIDAPEFAPPGHFYSPIPSKQDIEDYLARCARRPGLHELGGIDLDCHRQVELLDSLR